MSKNLIASVSKAGAKVRGLFETTKCLEKFFFQFFSWLFLRLSYRKGKKEQDEETGINRFLCESECKDKNFMLLLPKLLGSFFVLCLNLIYAFAVCQLTKAFFSWKAGAKVGDFKI